MDFDHNAPDKMLGKYLKQARVMLLTPEEVGQVFEANMGGTPWWPAGKPRPHCIHGQPMSFFGQIRLSDVPGFPSDSRTLVSFHYCMHCVYEGNMPFGWGNDGYDFTEYDPGKATGYDLSLFEVTETDQPDGLGIIAEDIYGAHSVEFVDRIDEPFMADMENIPELTDYQDLKQMSFLERLLFIVDEEEEGEDKSGSFTHEGWQRFKLGGWPEWCQAADWPLLYPDEEVLFLGQLGPITGDESWCDGVVYLFIPKDQDRGGGARMVLQVT